MSGWEVSSVADEALTIPQTTGAIHQAATRKVSRGAGHKQLREGARDLSVTLDAP